MVTFPGSEPALAGLFFQKTRKNWEFIPLKRTMFFVVFFSTFS
jgi:hypothetical protein